MHTLRHLKYYFEINKNVIIMFCVSFNHISNWHTFQTFYNHIDVVY